METYFKAVRVDGTSFHDPNFNWLTEDGVVGHPRPDLTGSAANYLSVATVATVASDCTGFYWPCRLLVVEPIGEVVPDNSYPNKRRGRAFKVVDEVEAWQVFGPNGKEVVAFLELLPMLTKTQWYAAWVAARDAAWDAARDAARDAAWALVLRDVLSVEHFNTLTAPMRAAGIDFDTLG